MMAGLTTSMRSAGGLVLGVSLAAIQGCAFEDGGEGPCMSIGLICPYEGVAEGHPHISGLRSVDAFFSAVVTFSGMVTRLNADIDAELQAIARSLDLDPGATSAEISAALQTRLSTAVSDRLIIAHHAPRCAIEASATVEAAARCDGLAVPGAIEVDCAGSCEPDASVDATCEAGTSVRCVGPAPMLACDGLCKGTCAAKAGVDCEGTCTGGCTGTCSVIAANGDCAGQCTGTCTGSCELDAAAACAGTCEGECTYVPAGGVCASGGQIHCEAPAGARCNGRCDGAVSLTGASAECGASVAADVNTRVNCSAPALTIQWQWSIAFAADPAAQVGFKAWLAGFKGRFAALLAATRRAELVLSAGSDLGLAAAGSVKDALETYLQDDALNVQTAVGLVCALTELGTVGGIVSDRTSELNARVSAVAELTAVIRGG